jgi:hypothetical protein
MEWIIGKKTVGSGPAAWQKNCGDAVKTFAMRESGYASHKQSRVGYTPATGYTRPNQKEATRNIPKNGSVRTREDLPRISLRTDPAL